MNTSEGESTINWRRLIAARYDDFPDDERVGKVYESVHHHLSARIAVLFDYKGDLQVIWCSPPSTQDMTLVAAAWTLIGNEPSESVSHYSLQQEGVSLYGGLWTNPDKSTP